MTVVKFAAPAIAWLLVASVAPATARVAAPDPNAAAATTPLLVDDGRQDRSGDDADEDESDDLDMMDMGDDEDDETGDAEDDRDGDDDDGSRNRDDDRRN
jgi:hypothetical protein